MPRTVRLDLTSQRGGPVIWISRVVLYSSLDPPNVIRSIPLHRGMNVVWGFDQDGEQDEQVDVVGHGVGKTSFCRLLRYCLGEFAFGRKDARERIRKNFPQGYVGAEVYVSGAKWSVLRPIVRGGRSYAASGIDLEQLLEDRRNHIRYDAFRQTVEDAALSESAVAMTAHTKEALKWHHLLAWCARDQEARYQELWQWRSPRSDSEPPGSSKPKVDGLYLIRTVLGLLTGDEARIQERLAELEQETETLKTQIGEAKREPDYWCKDLERQLKGLMGLVAEDVPPAEEGTLFDIVQRVQPCRRELEGGIKEVDDEIARLDAAIADLSASISEHRRELAFNRNLLGPTRAGVEELQSEIAERDREREQLAAVQDRLCTYGMVHIRACSHVQDRMETLSYTEVVDRQHAQEAARRREEEAERTRREISRLEAAIAPLERERSELQEKRRACMDQRYDLLRKLDGFSSTTARLESWRSVRDGNQPNTRVAELQTRLNLANQQAEALRQELTRLLDSHAAHVAELRRVFDRAVKKVLTPDYNGEVAFKNGELEFQIRHGTTLAGEAIETLTILLADVCSMMFGTASMGSHPSLLIHDSPREADLGPRIYRSFLRFVAGLHEDYGGSDKAPFQYIITTTTAPPTELQGDEFVCLKLKTTSEADLLFCKNLGAAEDQDEGEDRLPLEDEGKAES